MKTKVLIAGGGIAGLTQAALLGAFGIDCVIIDAEKPTSRQNVRITGRTLALWQGSINVLKTAGVWDLVADQATPLQCMQIIDDSAKSLPDQKVRFYARDIGYPEFGFNIPNYYLKAALAECIAAYPSVTHLTETFLDHYTAHDSIITARTKDGQTITADIIIGADGRNSVVRDCADIPVKRHDYGQIAMTMRIEHSLPHEHTSTEFHRTGGPFTIVPMTGQTSSLVWAEKTDDAKALLSMKKAELEQAAQDRTKGLVGKIKLISDPESWPLSLQNTDRIIAPRCALIAETIHVFSPIGAQGLNLSLRDIAALTETIVLALRTGQDIGSQTTLQRYARQRRIDLKTRTFGVDTLNRIVANDKTSLRGIRRTALRAINALPPLKTLAMHQGLAPMMESDNKILRGETL